MPERSFVIKIIQVIKSHAGQKNICDNQKLIKLVNIKAKPKNITMGITNKIRILEIGAIKDRLPKQYKINGKTKI